MTPDDLSQDSTAVKLSALGAKTEFTSSMSRYLPYDEEPGVDTADSFDSN